MTPHYFCYGHYRCEHHSHVDHSTMWDSRCKCSHHAHHAPRTNKLLKVTLMPTRLVPGACTPPSTMYTSQLYRHGPLFSTWVLVCTASRNLVGTLSFSRLAVVELPTKFVCQLVLMPTRPQTACITYPVVVQCKYAYLCPMRDPEPPCLVGRLLQTTPSSFQMCLYRAPHFFRFLESSYGRFCPLAQRKPGTDHQVQAQVIRPRLTSWRLGS